MGSGLRTGAFVAMIGLLLVAAVPPDSPVADAAMKGDLEAVRTLLRAGADVNAAQGDGMTALHWAASRGDKAMAQVLIYAGANVASTTRLGAHTPLLLASRGGYAPVIETLLSAGADANAATSTGVAPIHFAAASGSSAAIDALVKQGADVNAKESASGQTPLMFAAASNRVDAIRTLVQHGADLTIRSTVVDIPERSQQDAALRRQRNALIAAARGDGGRGDQGDPTEELQGRGGGQQQAQRGGRGGGRGGRGGGQRGGQAQAQGDQTQAQQGQQAQRAGGRGQRDTSAAELQGNDAQDQDSTANRQQQPAAPRSAGHNEQVGGVGGLAPLHYAVRQGHAEAVAALLDAGADIDEQSAGDRSSPLLVAAINGQFDIGTMLLERGADPNLGSNSDVTPLYGAINVQWAPHAFYPQPTTAQEKATHLDFIEALLRAGANPDARVTTKVWYTGYNFDQSGINETGATPFWRAAQSSDAEAMRLLVKYGADPNLWTVVTGGGRGGRGGNNDPSGLPPVPPGGPAFSPLHAATGSGYDGNFHRNASYGWLPAVKYLVDELGFDVNVADQQGYTPIHNAAFRGDNEMILYLISKGGNVKAVARNGSTTVDRANGPIQRLQPFPETIRLLESMGATNNHRCVSC
jgi:ankyrin repeat protein